MVTEIKYGKVNECECNNCKSTLRYHKSDIQCHICNNYYYKWTSYYISCPVCGNLIEFKNELTKEIEINIQQ